MSEALTESQQAALRDLCDTVVPSIERDPDPEGLWARAASDYGTDRAVEQQLLGIPDPVARGGLIALLDVCAAQGLGDAPSQDAREAILAGVGELSPEAGAGVAALVGMTLFLHYGAPDPKGGGVESGPRFFEQPTCHWRPEVRGGVLAEEASALLKAFFRERREARGPAGRPAQSEP